MKFIVSLVVLFVSLSIFAESNWDKKSVRYYSIGERITAAKEEIKGLIKQKNAVKDQNSKQKVIEQIKEIHKKMQEEVKEYNKLGNELRFKFPNKGDKTERKYLPMREQSIEEIENESSINNILSRVKNKVDKKYRKYTKEEKKNVNKPRMKKKDDDKKEKRLKLER